MRLQQKLDAFKAEFLRTAPAGRPALYETKIDELRASFALDRALRTGEQAPEFTLPDQRGKGVSLATLLGSGPAVVTFYRGGMVPLLQHPAPRISGCPTRNDRARRTAGRDLAATAGRLAVDRRGERTELRRAQRRWDRVAAASGWLVLSKSCARRCGRTTKRCRGSTATTVGSYRCRPLMSSPATAASLSPALTFDYRNRLEPDAILNVAVAAPGMTLPGTRAHSTSAANRRQARWRQHSRKDTP